VTKNSICGSCGKAISVLSEIRPSRRLVPHTSPATKIAHFPPLLHNIYYFVNGGGVLANSAPPPPGSALVYTYIN